MAPAVLITSLEQYQLRKRGKVRDVYDAGSSLLMVATDRISAFDVVMAQGVPGKGALLNEISAFWFDKTKSIVDNHVIATSIDSLSNLSFNERTMLKSRSMLVKKTTPLAVECVVRGYLAGSAWKEYQQSQTVCGIPLPGGLEMSAKLPEPLYTPSTKAETGHDENITFEQTVDILGEETATRVRDLSIKLYTFATKLAAKRGLLIADTKFEFGIENNGNLILIDEVLTPDSSRYWLADTYAVGQQQENFDKQVLRDWLETQDWNKQPPPPELPASVISSTYNKYLEARDMICGY